MCLSKKYETLAGLGLTFHYYTVSQLNFVLETCMLLKTFLTESSGW